MNRWPRDLPAHLQSRKAISINEDGKLSDNLVTSSNSSEVLGAMADNKISTQ